MDDSLNVTDFPAFLAHYSTEDYLTSIRLLLFLEKNYGHEFEERFNKEPVWGENPPIVSQLLSEQNA
jgi:hypothetical protein